jgi:hypothetical protein
MSLLLLELASSRLCRISRTIDNNRYSKFASLFEGIIDPRHTKSTAFLECHFGLFHEVNGYANLLFHEVNGYANLASLSIPPPRVRASRGRSSACRASAATGACLHGRQVTDGYFSGGSTNRLSWAGPRGFGRQLSRSS